ncbi:hypothetical protein ACLM5J_02820 [Nocardioides sp. Bht2]|uniref:hypothetical protein n=1 Tax=Nocardioides sp. Bht2 TaxID=3392297 RepID=UPI0039B56D67
MTDDAMEPTGPDLGDAGPGRGDDPAGDGPGRDDLAGEAFRAAFAREAHTFQPTSADDLLASLPTVRRRPLRRWAAPLAAAVAVGMIGVGVAAVIGSDESTSNPDASVADRTTSGGDWRYESIGDVSIKVPEAWPYLSPPGDQWCVNEKAAKATTAEPYVGLSSGFSTLVLCTNEEAPSPIFGDLPARFWSTHIELGFVTPEALPEGETAADGWTRIVQRAGEVQLTGYADAEHLELIRKVLASVRVAEADPLGCPATAPTSVRPPAAFDVETVKVSRVVICQYYADGLVGPQVRTTSWPLQASREIPDPEALLAAIQSARPGGGPDRPKTCIETEQRGPDFVLRLETAEGLREIWGRAGNCRYNGLDDGTTVREITTANCAPLWGGRVRLWVGSSAVMERCQPS